MASCKALEVLEITGRNSKLSGLDKDNDGVYEFSATTKKSAEASARGYSVEAEITEVTVSLTVHLFGETCLIGDVNHDGEINVIDAGLIQEYLAEMDPAVFCFRGADVNGDGEITVIDAGLLREYLAELIDVFPAESK